MADVNNFIDLDCEQSVVYTGVGDCPLSPGIPKGFIAIPRGTTFDDAEWADIINELAEMATENPYSTRALPIGPIIALTDNSTEAVVETTDYGYILPVRAGTIVWTVRFGYGFGEHMQMKSMAGKHNSFDFLILFANGVMGTRRRNATTGDTEHGGFRFSYIDVLTPKFASSSTAENYSMTIQIADSAQLQRLSWLASDSLDITDVPGVQEVIMTGVVNASPAGSVDIDARVKYGGKTLVEIYGTTVADITLFEATNTLTGNAITLTGATIVNGKIRLHASTVDTDYPAVSAQWTITPAPIADWVTAGIVGYEISNTVTVTRP